MMEPICLVTVTVMFDKTDTVTRLIERREGTVFQVMAVTPQISTLRGYLPATNSIGFAEEVRRGTHGNTFVDTIFDRYQIVDVDPLRSGTKVFELIQSIRRRKGMNQEIPPLAQFLDKL
jgi:elongation factor 2